MTAHRASLADSATRLIDRAAAWMRRRQWLPDRADVATAVENDGTLRIAAAGIALLGLGAVLVALGVVLPEHVTVALVVAGGLLALGATAFAPMAVPLLAMPFLVVVNRIGGGGVDLSVSDFVLFATFWICVLLGHRPYSRPMRSLLWVTVAYQLATAFTVLWVHDSATVTEWFHAWLLTAGAVVVGWSVGRRGLAPAALTLLALCCAVIAVASVQTWLVQWLQGRPGPAYPAWPFPMHKNFVGTTVSFGAILAYARPAWLRWPRWLSVALFWLLTAGVAASEARQAYVALAVGVLVVLARRSGGVRHSPWILLPVLVAVVVVVTLLRDQIQEDNPFNSAYQRLTWFQQAIAVWSTSPVFGVGLRWWYTGRFPYAFQPPNAELEVLSSAGVVGLAGFVVLMVGSLVVLWRLRPDYGTLGFAVLLTRFTQGQFDLFWVAVSVSIPYLMAGLCLGAAAKADESPPPLPTGAVAHVPVMAAAR